MKNTLGSRIKELRKNRDLTQQQLAKLLGISASSVGMYEQDRRKPDNETLLKLCNVFDTSADYILGKAGTAARVGKNVDVADVFDEFTEKLMLQQGLMFDGTPLNDNDRMKIVDALKVVAALAKQEHKKSVGGD